MCGLLSRKKMSTRDDGDLLPSVAAFYTPAVVGQVLPILQGTSGVSLHTIYWFVSDYAKRRRAFIDMHRSYCAQLEAHSKHRFCPFRTRGGRVHLYYEKGRYIEATVGQLNFFHWMLPQTAVLEYIAEHAAEIDEDMRLRCRH